VSIVEVDRAADLSSKVDELAEWIYNGNLDDRSALRKAIAALVEQGMALGYDIGKATK